MTVDMASSSLLVERRVNPYDKPLGYEYRDNDEHHVNGKVFSERTCRHVVSTSPIAGLWCDFHSFSLTSLASPVFFWVRSPYTFQELRTYYKASCKEETPVRSC